MQEKNTAETPNTEVKTTEKSKSESKAKSVGVQTGATIKDAGKKIGKTVKTVNEKVQNMQEVKSKISKEEFFDIKQKHPDETFKSSSFGGIELFPTFTKSASAKDASQKSNMGGSSLSESLGFSGLVASNKDSSVKAQGMGYSLGESLGVGMFGSSTQGMGLGNSLGIGMLNNKPQMGSSLSESLGFSGLVASNKDSPVKTQGMGYSLSESLGFNIAPQNQPISPESPQQIQPTPTKQTRKSSNKQKSVKKSKRHTKISTSISESSVKQKPMKKVKSQTNKKINPK
jgi:hypothetical protein